MLHAYAGQLTTPRGQLARTAEDPASFAVTEIDLGEQFSNYGLVGRFRHERRYGSLLASSIREFAPDVVMSGNTPLDAQAAALGAAHAHSAKFIFWAQDLLSLAIAGAVRRRLPVVGRLVGWRYARLERRLLRDSDAVVAISQQMAERVGRWGVPQRRLSVIENWAPIGDLPEVPRANAWATAHGLADTFNFLYSGTLGLKHQPEFLFELARHVRQRTDARVVVVSQGLGVEWLQGACAREELANLVILPFQAIEDLPQVLGSGDVLVALLRGEAGDFSVPSKVTSYLCAGRPVLAAVPKSNLAAQVLEESGGGLVVDCDSVSEFLDGAQHLSEVEARRFAMGRAARKSAEQRFDIGRITDKFEALMQGSGGDTGQSDVGRSS